MSVRMTTSPWLMTIGADDEATHRVAHEPHLSSGIDEDDADTQQVGRGQ
jgi:hypothetical protein